MFPLAHSRSRDEPVKGTPMSILKKIAHMAEALKGSAKKTAGRATGGRRLKAEGRGDRAKGHLKQAGAKVKDAVKR
jgi:uncharacterized protein YjbJ (UPF0337 family)